MKPISELKKEIRTVGQIRQMTRALELVAAVKRRRAKSQLDSAFPFFATCAETMAILQQQSPEIASPLMNFREKKPGEPWRIMFLVFTGDQGMAGAYNLNVLAEAEKYVNQLILDRVQKGFQVTHQTRLLGAVGPDEVKRQHLAVDQDFSFPIAPATYRRATVLSNRVRRAYLAGETDEVCLIFTRLKRNSQMEVMKIHALPADHNELRNLYSGYELEHSEDMISEEQIEYLPDVRTVLAYLFDTYLNGLIYGVMNEAFASEQTARMTAMESATESADDILGRLKLESNRARQTKITGELTEIVSGAQVIEES